MSKLIASLLLSVSMFGISARYCFHCDGDGLYSVVLRPILEGEMVVGRPQIGRRIGMEDSWMRAPDSVTWP